MKIILLLTMLLTSIFANVAVVSAFNGKATVIRAGKTFDVTIGFKLEKNDELKTQNNTKLQLLFTDKTIISIGKNSEFSIQEYLFDEANPKDVKASFNFTKGLFRTVTGKIGKINPNKFNIKVKNASIGIRGTRFDVFVSASQVKVGLFQGEIVLFQNGIKTPLLAGQVLVYTIGGKVEVKEGILEESKELHKKLAKRDTKKVIITAKEIKKFFDTEGVTKGTIEDIINSLVDEDIEELIKYNTPRNTNHTTPNYNISGSP